MQIHTQRHTRKKKSATSRGFVVSSCWLPFPNARRNKLPTVAFFLHFARSIAFFLHFARPIAFFYFLPVTSLFFFALCLSHCIFFCTLPVPSLFFYTLPVTSLFFALCLSHRIFFAIWWLLRFFLQSSVPIAFFLQREDWRSQRCFFLQDVSASLDCCNSGCISVCTFAFILHFFRFFPIFLHFELQVAKKCDGKNTLVSIAFFLRQRARRRPGLHF